MRYYGRTSSSRALFEHTRLAASDPVQTTKGELAWDAHLCRFDVIQLAMTDFFKAGKPITSGLVTLTKRVLGELGETYPQVSYDKDDLSYSMGRFYQATGTQFVIVIDEWDAAFRQRQNDKDGQREFLDFLRDWLKDKPYVALAYMTGILATTVTHATLTPHSSGTHKSLRRHSRRRPIGTGPNRPPAAR